MFAVFTDQACTANIYTHKLNIACMHACCRKAAIPQSLYPRNIPAIRYIRNYIINTLLSEYVTIKHLQFANCMCCLTL